MTPQELRQSIICEGLSGLFFNQKPWVDEETNSIYKYLWELTAWDKKFQNVDNYKQKKVITYKYVLAKEFDKLKVDKGDVYLLSTGSYEGFTTKEVAGDVVSYGEVVTMPWGGGPTIKYYKGMFVTSDNRIATSLDVNVLENKYLYYFMLSKTKYLDSIYRGTSLRHPKMALVLDMRIPLPPLEEQKRIIAKIEELMPLVDKYEIAYNKLQALNKQFPIDLEKSILQYAMEGKLVEQRPEEGTGEDLFKLIQQEKKQLIKEGKIKKEKELPNIQEDEIPFDIPSTWKWVRLSSIMLIKNGFTPLRTEDRYWKNGTINWMTVEDINEQGKYLYSTKQHITIDAVKNKDRIVQENSIFICCTSATIGRIAINKVPMVSNQQFNGLVIKQEAKKLLSIEYLYWYASILKSKLIEIAGITTFPFVSVNKLGNLLVPLPPLKEQNRIVAKIEEILPLIRKLF